MIAKKWTCDVCGGPVTATNGVLAWGDPAQAGGAFHIVHHNTYNTNASGDQCHDKIDRLCRRHHLWQHLEHFTGKCDAAASQHVDTLDGLADNATNGLHRLLWRCETVASTVEVVAILRRFLLGEDDTEQPCRVCAPPGAP